MTPNLERLKEKIKAARSRARMRGDHELNEHMDRHQDPRKAAVMILLVPHKSGFTVILNERSDNLPHHPGQISFPGGKMEKGDKSIIATALRETHEEIGIPGKDVTVIGVLDTYVTRTGFEITPVVGILKPPVKFKINKNEVKHAFEVPLKFLTNPNTLKLEHAEFKGKTYRFMAWEYQSWRIWGATANILRNLIEHLEDECEQSLKQSKSAEQPGWTKRKR